jgi:HPt (histidine-containing phosphotransfer) domain-containing protein
VNLTLILDVEELMNRVDNDREFVAELFEIFKTELPGHLQQLRDAVDCGDSEGVAREGHNLKGMLLSLSAKKAAGAAGELEASGREKRMEKMKAGLAAFEREMATLLPEMETCVKELSP